MGLWRINSAIRLRFTAAIFYTLGWGKLMDSK